jgi:hypothetical protein
MRHDNQIGLMFSHMMCAGLMETIGICCLSTYEIYTQYLRDVKFKSSIKEHALNAVRTELLHSIAVLADELCRASNLASSPTICSIYFTKTERISEGAIFSSLDNLTEPRKLNELANCAAKLTRAAGNITFSTVRQLVR